MSRIDFSRVVTAADRKRSESRLAAEAEARRVLAETDWYVVRKVETGAAIPRDVLDARKAARATLSEDGE